MNWKVILQLSIFGLGMAIATISLIPSNIESIFWLAIFLFCAYTIAKRCDGKHFLHGFMVSIFNCVWITAIHFAMADTYLANHKEEATMMQNMPMSAKTMMLIVGPVIGVVSGLVLGLFAFIAGKLVKKG